MKTIQLTFLFEDTGFCKDVFQSVNQPYYYCNRDTVMAHGTLLPRMIIKMIAASERMLSSRSSRMGR